MRLSTSTFPGTQNIMNSIEFNPSPLVLHDLPESERCVDEEMRSHRIEDLGEFYAFECHRRGRPLSASMQLKLRRQCETFARLVQKECLFELEIYDVVVLLDHLVKSGVTASRQLAWMRSMYEMFLVAAVEAQENDVELRSRLDDCAGLTCAYSDPVCAHGTAKTRKGRLV